jgi:GPH family glycoside/pentoside/hexuronide:cation symporter
MPYYGLQLELTPNYDERTRLTVVMTFVGKILSFFAGWAFVAIVFVGTIAKGDLSSVEDKPEWVQSMVASIQPLLTTFAGDHLDDKPIVLGMKILCWFFAAMLLVFGIMPALFVKERYYDKEACKQKPESFWKSMKESATCKPLWSLISVSFFLVMGYASIGGLGTYVIIYYVCDGDMLQAGVITGLKGSVLAVTGIALLPFFTWLGEKLDKRKAVMLMLMTCIFGHLLNYFLMTPEMPYLQIVSGFFEATAIGAVWLFLPSMKADVADWDEVDTKRRREGSINAFYSWFIKTSLVLSMGIGGAVLEYSGYNASLEHQATEVVDKMFHLYLILPTIIWCIALLSVWFYPLSRERAASIRKELEDRRGYV